jgi:hypothetical protein
VNFLSKYGVARHIYVPIVKRAVVDFAVGADWTPAAGDCKISKDGGAAANVTNLPTAITMGNTAMWDFSLTATEMEAAQVVVMVADSATKVVEDQSFLIETYGNASGQHAVDLDDGVRAGLTALPNAAAEAAGGLYTRGSGAGQINQPANGMIDANVVRNAGSAIVASGGRQEVNVSHFGGSAGTFASGRPEVNTTHWRGTAAPAEHTAGYPIVTIKDGTGTGELATTSGAIDTVTTLTNAPPDSAGVTTLLSRIPSALFSGITSLAQWLGLLAGKQVGNSTARTEIRATGAGSGTFDETTDSLEATRDNIGTTGAALSLAKGAQITGFNDLSAAQVNTEADTALADVGVTTTVTGRIDVAVSSRATPAQVNAEVLDVLNVDTFAEPGQEAPPATTTLVKKIGWLYKAFRNRVTQDATTMKIYADDGTTVDAKATVSDNGTTYDRNEVVSGP